ncbi:hypothetical protein M3P36_08610 [Altererythrobacter sp. KTW20L]|uniref:hypothetical protein n=1 Tax=Altererythrobacter sp. KTW20L TaxID=2942210 RepID=UPI0020C08677|nr:hypothetical protein [Altererythrobacter sp. KTW20L]MCL6251102.1 hypothetical protein [Altererythrobacter sp. KTW20L]
MRIALWMVPPLLLAGCAEEISPQEQEMRDAQAVAALERANSVQPPLTEVVPETIEAEDVERYDIKGASCSYAPGTSLGVRVVARQADAFMKVDGEVLRFASDPGARALPMETRSLYNGRSYSLRLELANEDAAPAAGTRMEGTITLRDRWERVVYSGSGQVTCTSGRAEPELETETEDLSEAV